MQQIQVSRGKLDVRVQSPMGKLLYGELFLDSKNKAKSWELYIGDETGASKKIGGEGVLTYIDKITTLPVGAEIVEGGVYYVDADIDVSGEVDPSTGENYPEYKKGDLAIYSTKFGGWIRVGQGSTNAVDVLFNNKNTNLSATNLQQALVELDRNKLSFGGDLKLPTELSPEPVGETKDTIFGLEGNNKAGYYYAITAKDGITIDNVKYEEGDFLAITSNKLDNKAPLTAADVVFTKISGGTHKAEKIYIEGLVRGNTTAASVYKDEDAKIKNVAQALDSVFKTKADLDPTTKKVLLAELPDTIIGSLDFQGTYDKMGVLPTGADKPEQEQPEAELVKGDYWLYVGEEWDLGTVGPDGFYDVGGVKVSSSEGVISKGDTLVYNGTKSPTWSVLDNTAPFYGVKADAGDELDQREPGILNGMVTFHGGKRRHGDALLDEVNTVSSKTDNSITVSSPNAALINADVVNANKIYKEAGDKTLVETGLSEEGDSFVINEKNGMVLKGGTLADGTVLGAATIKQNEAQASDISLQLPAETGTLARKEDLKNVVNGQDYYVPRFTVDESNNVKLMDSPMEIITDDTSYDGFTYHHNLTQSATVMFKRGAGEVVNVFPNYHGYVLNSNSIIDCGEWTDTGLKFNEEGKFSNYHGDETESAYVERIRQSASEAVPENIVAHVIDDTTV